MVIEQVIKLLLRITSFGHIIEVGSAIAENAYVTASLALFFSIIELYASFYVKECKCD